MNPALTNGLFKSINSIENNGLPTSVEMLDTASGGQFANDFSAAIKDLLSAGGNTTPLDLAALEGLDAQQLTGLLEQSGIQLPTRLLAGLNQLKHDSQQNLAHGASTSIEGANIIGNPDANALLKTNLLNDDVLEAGISARQFLKEGSVPKYVTTTDVFQQSLNNKESSIPNVLTDTDTDLSQFMKTFSTKDVDISKELLMQAGNQGSNGLKLVDQLSSMDKPINALTSINNSSMQTTSSSEQSGMMLRRIEVPVQQAGWGDAVGNRLMMMVNDKIQTAKIHLNPAELGSIEVKVSINQDQASVHFISSHTAVRDAIEEAFPRLREMFQQNGISLADANVSQESPQQGNTYSDERHDASALLNNESPEVAELGNQNTRSNIIDVGLIDHYV